MARALKISCSTQLSMYFFLLLKVEMATVVGISNFMDRKISVQSLSYEHLRFHAQLS